MRMITRSRDQTQLTTLTFKRLVNHTITRSRVYCDTQHPFLVVFLIFSLTNVDEFCGSLCFLVVVCCCLSPLNGSVIVGLLTKSSLTSFSSPLPPFPPFFSSFQAVVVIKYFFQFGFIPWNDPMLESNDPLDIPRILGIEKQETYATFDLVRRFKFFNKPPPPQQQQ